MKVSLSWLREYVDVTMAPEAVAEALTMAGLEVDAVEDRFAFLGSVRVARIKAISPHPKADRLKCCTVDTGEGTVSVVCGAPNAAEGMLTAYAMPGTLLPNGAEIQAGVIRGERSEGMLCSEWELGLGPDAGGIMALDPGLGVGTPLNVALALSDPVFEIDLTPNRSDCLSVIGIAREVAALTGAHLRYPEIRLPEAGDSDDARPRVDIEAPDLCTRYAAGLVVDVAIGPSPFWLQDRLLSVGLKPISNVVDVTNFVMLETGQPLHAFDFDHLAEHRIVVRTAAEGEAFTTLDGKDRILAGDMLMICDGEKPVAVGGVMGGLNSEIEDRTTRVLIESACFNPASVRRTAKRLGLATDASHRFERGVDPEGTVTAMNRAAQLICAVAGGRLVEGFIDNHPRPHVRPRIRMRTEDINRRLGIQLDAETMARLLRAIEFAVEPVDEDAHDVVPPPFRVDVGRWEDLSEEIARLYGYNRIETTLPRVPAAGRALHPKRALREQVRQRMIGLGFSEAINYSFIHRNAADRLRLPEDDAGRNTVGLLNPLSEEQAVMRTSLIPGLLDTLQRNLSVQNRDLRLFEIGQVFFSTGDVDALPVEGERVAVVVTGAREPKGWLGKSEPFDFYDIKGVAEALFDAIGLPGATFSQMPGARCHVTATGATARVAVGDTEIGTVGLLDPRVRDGFGLRQDVFLFEFDTEPMDRLRDNEITAWPIPKYPAVNRDITMILDDTIEAQRVVDALTASAEPLMEEAYLFDVYAGEPIAEGKKSISLRIVYRSTTQTLEDDAVNALHRKLTDRLLTTFKADLPA